MEQEGKTKRKSAKRKIDSVGSVIIRSLGKGEVELCCPALPSDAEGRANYKAFGPICIEFDSNFVIDSALPAGVREFHAAIHSGAAYEISNLNSVWGLINAFGYGFLRNQPKDGFLPSDFELEAEFKSENHRTYSTIMDYQVFYKNTLQWMQQSPAGVWLAAASVAQIMGNTRTLRVRIYRALKISNHHPERKLGAALKEMNNAR